MLPLPIRKYLLIGAEGAPAALQTMLKSLPAGDPRWDARPDPERFTLREVVAHLADWEPIHLERWNRVIAEEEPVLPDMDEGRMAIERGYATADPHEALQRFAEGRAKLVAFWHSLPESAWSRTAIRPPVIGKLTLEHGLTLVVAHDAYHFKQVADWLAQTP